MSKQRILELAKAMIDGDIGIIEGCSKICYERGGLHESLLQSDEIMPFVSFESELHSFPIGEARKHWNPQALKSIDVKLSEIIRSAQPEIIEACHTLVKKWSQHQY